MRGVDDIEGTTGRITRGGFFARACGAALREDANLRAGLNVHDGHVTYQAVADALALPYAAAEKVLTG